jgi:hypothetical protein
VHLYIYYDVPLAAVAEVRRLARSMQAELMAHCARTSLQKRSPAAAHAETWMEVYEDVADGFEALLAEAVERCGLSELACDRHVERFVDVA